MKKIFLILTLSVIVTITCQAQVIYKSNFVKVPLPDGAHKISNQQVDAIPGPLKMQTKIKTDYSPPYKYRINEILLGFFEVNSDSINNDLPRTKKFEDEGYGVLKRYNNNTYTSTIKNFGKKQALIINYVSRHKGHYNFYIQNEAKTLTQAGRIEYPEADSANAKALLNEILIDTQFTK